MIRIAIVEDEKNYISILQEYLKQYETEHSVTFQVDTFSDGLDIVSDYSAKYDIILLDIQMTHLDGMKTAEKIRSLDEKVAIIFITSTVSFAVQGYMVDALGYVLKPVPYLAFSQILGKAVKQSLKEQSRYYIHIDVDGGQMRLDTAQIYYIESQRHHVLFHTEQGDFLTAGPMKKIEAELSSYGFSKCHNAYLVNLSHIIGVLQNNALLSNKSELPISRARKKAFMDDLTNYMGGICK